MPVEEAIGAGLNIILELIKILNPSELEKLKKEIHKLEEKNEGRVKALKEAVASGDVDAINSILFPVG